MIIDSFIFYNELDLLFYRLSILNEYVDYFILVESTHTFSGNIKPLFYDKNKEKYSIFNDKIIHVIVDDFPYKAPNINYNLNNQWQNEYHQRNSISRGLNKIVHILNDNDIILTSDLDEIPNPIILQNIMKNNLCFDTTRLNRLELDMYYYNLHYKIGEGNNWHGIKLLTFATYNTIKLSFQEMRTFEWTNFVPIVKNGGWHLSYFGDANFIINKIQGFSHQEFNNDLFIEKDIVEKKHKNGVNLLNNTKLIFIPIEENNNLPYKYNIFLKDFFTNKNMITP
jgi:beta-1,4-mannosyl-glycoprotein beta-1,4-N-acetylglucosaminyltransferase